MVSISVKIVSGVERSAIPDTIKMSEAAGRKLWGFNQATSLLPAAYRYRSLATKWDSGDLKGNFLNWD
jgi:hypothetical protein